MRLLSFKGLRGLASILLLLLLLQALRVVSGDYYGPPCYPYQPCNYYGAPAPAPALQCAAGSAAADAQEAAQQGCLPCGGPPFNCAPKSDCAAPEAGELAGFARPTSTARACTRGCNAATVPVVGFIRIRTQYEASKNVQVSPELTCQRCKTLGCPGSCVAGKGCVTCPAGSTAFYPSPRKSSLPTGEWIVGSALQPGNWTRLRLCTPCAALNCQSGACSKEGGCQKCRKDHFWTDIRNKTLPGYHTISLPQNFKSCTSCAAAKCGKCDQRLGCVTCQKGYHLWKSFADQRTSTCRTCKTLQCAECGNHGCTRCPAGSFMMNATQHGIVYKQCVRCSEIYGLRNCASCGQHKGCLRCKEGYIRMNSDLASIFDWKISSHGRAYGVCMDTSKFECVTSKDDVGCTSCPSGYALAKHDVAGSTFATCYNTAPRYDGEPRMRRLLAETADANRTAKAVVSAEGAVDATAPESSAPAPGPSYNYGAPPSPPACKSGFTQNAREDCVPCHLYNCALHSECSLPTTAYPGYYYNSHSSGSAVWVGTRAGKTCADGCRPSAVPVVGFLPLRNQYNDTRLVGTEVTCRTCKQLGCPNSCSAGRGCVSCPTGSTGYYPSPRKSLLPTGIQIQSSLKSKSWTQFRMCTPCAALNCKPGACLPNGGCKQCSPRHYFSEATHKELANYEGVGVMLPRNFKSCTSCDAAKCGKCDQRLGCMTCQKGYHLWKNSADQRTFTCQTCKTLQCADCGNHGCTRCPAGSFMVNATQHGVDYKQCVRCSEIASLAQCATCHQYRGCMKCRPGFMLLKSKTIIKAPDSTAPAPSSSPYNLVGHELFENWPETHNAVGKAFGICVPPGKLGCAAHRDFFGCTRCKGGFKLAAGKDYLEGVQMCVPVKQDGWYDGSPRF